MANEKQLISGPWSWTKDDIRLLKRLYPRGNTRKIAQRLCRPLTAVRQKAYDIGIKTAVYQYWTDDSVRLLMELYPNASLKELVKRLDRSAGSVKTKARELGLRKSKNYMKAVKSRPRRSRK